MSGVAHKRPRVLADLREHTAYIARDHPDAAARFLDAAEDAFAKLAEMPGMGPVYGLKAPTLADVRIWPIKGFRNHLVIYRPTPDGIEVLRVLHGARDIPRALSE